MNKFWKRRKPNLLIGSAVVLVSILVLLSGLLEGLEIKTLDARAKLKKSRSLDSQIVLVTIGDKAAAELGGWPITRDYYAYLLHILSELGIKVVGFDIFFGDPERVYSENDSLFAHFCQKAGNVYQAVFFRSLSEKNLSRSGSSKPAILNRFGIAAPQKSKFHFPHGNDPALPLDVLLNSCKGIGHIHFDQDRDGVVRKTPLFIEYGDRLFPSLGFALACELLSVDMNRISFGSKKYIELILDDGKTRRIPVDEYGQVHINYSCRPEELPCISILQLFESYRQKDKAFLETFRDKIVLIAANVSGVPALLSTPVSSTYPSAGIQAQIIENILRQDFLRRSSFPLRVLLVLILGILISLSPVTKKLYVNVLFPLFLLGLYVVFAVLVFLLFNWWFDLVVPVFVIVSWTLATVLNLLWQESRKLEAVVESRRAELETAQARAERERRRLELKLSQKIKELQAIQEELRSFQKREHPEETNAEEAEFRLRTLMKRYPKLEAITKKKIIGKSQAITKVLEDVVLCASTDEPVLIRGETGTGKTLVAEAIHQLSPRGAKGKRMMTFNCARFEAGDPRILLGELFGYGPHHGIANLPKEGQDGILKEADGGTVFLDEVGDLPPQGQNLLLGPLDGKEFYPAIGKRMPIKSNVRFIFATNKNLEDLVERGSFREDLLSRIRIFQIKIPPLRERKEDIEVLVEHFLQKENAKYGSKIREISTKVMNILQSYPWHDNIRGLENTIKFAATKARLEGADILRVKHLPDELQDFSQQDSPAAKRIGSEDTLLPALRKHSFNILETARELKRDRDTITQWFKGICFVTLCKHNWALRSAAEVIAGDRKELIVKVEMKIKEYLKGIFTVAKTNPDLAKEQCFKMNRKLPQRYQWALEKLVEACLEDKIKL